MTNSEVLEIRIKYLNLHIEYVEKELVRHREYCKRLTMELNRARRLEREELQDVTKP